MAPDKKNVINAYPKYKLEFKFFSSPSPAFIHKLEMNNILYCLLVLFPLTNPGVDTICGLSLLLVLSLALRGFSPGTPVFPSPQKPTFPNSNLTRNQVDEEPLCGCVTSKSLFIYLFIYLFYLLAG